MWGSSFVGCHPARIRPSVPPSSSPPPPLIIRSLTHSLTHPSLTHSLTHSLIHTHNTRSHHSLTHSHSLTLTHSLTHSLTPSLTPALSAVSRDCRRACGARGRRWAPRSLQWQAQYSEAPEGAAARVVAAGPPAVLCVTAIVICKAMVVNRIVMAAARMCAHCVCALLPL